VRRAATPCRGRRELPSSPRPARRHERNRCLRHRGAAGPPELVSKIGEGVEAPRPRTARESSALVAGARRFVVLAVHDEIHAQARPWPSAASATPLARTWVARCRPETAAALACGAPRPQDTRPKKGGVNSAGHAQCADGQMLLATSLPANLTIGDNTAK